MNIKIVILKNSPKHKGIDIRKGNKLLELERDWQRSKFDGISELKAHNWEIYRL